MNCIGHTGRIEKLGDAEYRIAHGTTHMKNSTPGNGSMNERTQILIVENEPTIALDTQGRLESMGYDVPAIVSFGEDAIRKAGELHPNLVLMDMILKGDMDGVEAAGRIRARFDIPVVFVTTDAGDPRLVGVMRSEPYGCLFRPFEDMALDLAVRMALNRHRQEAALRESEKMYRLLVENAGDCVAIIDNEGVYRFMNELGARLLGGTPEDFVGKPVSEVFSEEIADLNRERVSEIIETGEGRTYEDCLNFPSGDRWFTINIQPVKDSSGNIIGTQGIARDITERKKAEEDRARAESLLKAALESTADGILVVSMDGTWTTCNQKFIDMWGIPDSIRESGDDNAALNHVLTSVAAPEKFLAEVRALYKNPERESFDTIELKDGRIFERYSHPQWLKEEIAGRVWSFRDITTRKRAEETMKAHREHLALINQILRHDLTNDLVVIQCALNLYNHSPDEECLKEISSHTEKSIKLIRRMRELESFISRHKKLQICEVRDVLEKSVENYSSIIFEITGRGRVMADDSLSSVIDNIIRNAFVHGKSDRITITTKESMGMCEVRIADNGRGIPDEIKEKVFEKGFRHGATGNTGIGLHIVHEAMESYGGHVWIEDNTPKGAVFVLRFVMVH